MFSHITEFKTQVPGKYTLVDHTSRDRTGDYRRAGDLP
jgi:hypothetical protein